MAVTREFKTDIVENIFNINDEVEVSPEEANYLFDLEERILDSFEENGEAGSERIKEEVMDDLLKNEYYDLIKYLNLEIPKEIEDSFIEKMQDESLFKVEESDKSEDFFNNYLIDDVINDIIYNLKGFERKSDGAKEVFVKRRKALIPNPRIGAIQNIIISIFNKTNFLSKKEDLEQAKIIMMAYKAVFQIILEIPYEICDTQKTIEILNMIALKLSNLIGLSEGFRTDFLETVKESLQSERKLRERQNNNEND